MNMSGAITFDTMLAREAKKVIEVRIEALKEELSRGGYGYSDTQYRVTSGKIMGLREALELLSVAETTVIKN